MAAARSGWSTSSTALKCASASARVLVPQLHRTSGLCREQACAGGRAARAVRLHRDLWSTTLARRENRGDEGPEGRWVGEGGKTHMRELAERVGVEVEVRLREKAHRG